MKTKPISTYSQTNHNLQFMNNMEIDISITNNPFNVDINTLFDMAARVNKKRGFLFVSKVLGKHIPINPYVPLLTSGLLAMEYFTQQTGKAIENKEEIARALLSNDNAEIEAAYSSLTEQPLKLDANPIIIGFAETATALGHGVFNCFEKGHYLHTTREVLKDTTPTIRFEEEHSHAVDQLFYDQSNVLDSKHPIILVDDEITTGKTALNIIREIHANYPRNQYYILSILDWRSDENVQKVQDLESELGIRIATTSILKGQIAYRGGTLDSSSYNYHPTESNNKVELQYIDVSEFFTPCHSKYTKGQSFIKETGRFGISSSDKSNIDAACFQAANKLNSSKKGVKTLCLGTGELMYLPMKISSFMGDGVFYQSSTRSPIHPENKENYAVRNGFSFPNPEDPGTKHFIYNIPENEYEEIFLFLESEVPEETLQPIINICSASGVQHLNIVHFTNGGDSNA